MALVLELPPLLLILFSGLALVAGLAIGVVIMYPLARALHPIGFGDFNLGDSIGAFWARTEAELKAEFDVQVTNVNDLIDFASGIVQGFFDAATTTAEWLGLQVSNAIALAQSVGADAVEQIGKLLALVTAGAAEIAKLAADFASFAADITGKIIHAIQKQITEVTSQLHVAIETFVRSITDPLHRYVTEVHALLVHRIDVETNRAVAVETALRGDVADVATELGTEITQVKKTVLRRLGEGDKTLQEEIGNITDVIGPIVAGTTIVGLITTVATTLENLTRECVDPTCGFLGPQLPILNALQDAATLALVGGMIATAARNPQAGSDAAIGLWRQLQPMVNDTLGAWFGVSV